MLKWLRETWWLLSGGFEQPTRAPGLLLTESEPDRSVIDALAARLSQTPPSCLQNLAVVRADGEREIVGGLQTRWELGCRCNGRGFHFLGHPLASDPAIYLGPLALECIACGQTTELLDTDIHGFHAEVARVEGGVGSAKLRGEGPRSTYACPGCDATGCEVSTAFDYWGLDELAEMTEEGGYAVDNLFNVFWCDCRCTGCGQTFQPTDFGKL